MHLLDGVYEEGLSEENASSREDEHQWLWICCPLQCLWFQSAKKPTCCGTASELKVEEAWWQGRWNLQQGGENKGWWGEAQNPRGETLHRKRETPVQGGGSPHQGRASLAFRPHVYWLQGAASALLCGNRRYALSLFPRFCFAQLLQYYAPHEFELSYNIFYWSHSSGIIIIWIWRVLFAHSFSRGPSAAAIGEYMYPCYPIITQRTY